MRRRHHLGLALFGDDVLQRHMVRVLQERLSRAAVRWIVCVFEAIVVTRAREEHIVQEIEVHVHIMRLVLTSDGTDARTTRHRAVLHRRRFCFSGRAGVRTHLV